MRANARNPLGTGTIPDFYNTQIILTMIFCIILWLYRNKTYESYHENNSFLKTYTHDSLYYCAVSYKSQSILYSCWYLFVVQSWLWKWVSVSSFEHPTVLPVYVCIIICHYIIFSSYLYTYTERANWFYRFHTIITLCLWDPIYLLKNNL